MAVRRRGTDIWALYCDDCGGSIGGLVLRFEQLENFTGPLANRAGYTGELRDVDAVALTGGAWHDLMKEHHLVVPFFHCDVEIADAGQLIFEIGELVIVRRK